MAGFPSKIQTREQLIQILTTIIWTCTAQHAAINFNQYDMVSRTVQLINSK